MKTMTIKKFIREANENYLFTPVSNGSPVAIVEGVSTADFQHNLDLYMKHNLGSMLIGERIAEDLDDVTELKAEIREICGLLYNEKKYEYETLYNTTDLVYNPIENYDRTEEETYSGTINEDNIHTVGSQTNNHTVGAQSNSNVYGAVSEQDVIGQHTDSVQYGQNQTTHVNGATKTTTKNPQVQTTNVNGAKSHTEQEAHTTGVSAFDSAGTLSPVGNAGTGTTGNTNFNNKERVIDEKTVGDASVTDTVTVAAHDVEVDTDSVTNTDTVAQHTDTTTVGTHTDTHTEQSKTDTINLGQRQDSDSLGQRQDTDDNNHTNEWERELKVHGNIGTVTTQDMIKQEREIAMFNLLKVVAKDVAQRIAICIYG